VLYQSRTSKISILIALDSFDLSFSLSVFDSYAILERTNMKKFVNIRSTKTKNKTFAEHTIIQLHYISHRRTYIIVDCLYNSQYILQCVFFLINTRAHTSTMKSLRIQQTINIRFITY